MNPLSRALTVMGLLVAAVVMVKAAGERPAEPITIFWTDTNSVAPEVCVVYHSTSLKVPMAQWEKMAVLSGTNPAVPGVRRTNYVVWVQPGEHYFALTFSNFWGETGFSAVASTPGLLGSGEVGVKRGQ